ncbi:MAG: hypothetical protein IPG45_23955 [Deltaproteobacteria bacterium]|jgi:hypothetical protein|nr:hypothetical protein [Deltaproteobacteria bacterium]
MASDLRLERLGLAHLKDQPELLRKELELRVAEGERFEEEVVLPDMEEIRRRLGIEEPPLSTATRDDGAIGRVGLKRSKTGLRSKDSGQR